MSDLTKENNLTQQHDIKHIRDRVLARFPLLGPTIMSASITADPNINTACTDGVNIMYSPKYFTLLSENEKDFVIAHEMMHIAFNHVPRMVDRDLNLWNIATDAVINQMLQKEGLPIIRDCINIKEAANLSAEEMYDKLKHKQEERSGCKCHKKDNDDEKHGGNGNKCSGQCGCGENQKQDNDWDDSDIDWDNLDRQVKNHDSWKESAKEQQEQTCDNCSSQDQSNYFEKNFSKNNAQVRHDMAEQIRDQVQKVAGMAVPNNKDRHFADIGHPDKPISDWKKLLKKAVEETEKVYWSYRRSSIDNDYMSRIEAFEESERFETEVMLDVSGSVNHALLKEFLRQLKPILKESKLKVGCFDITTYPFKEIKTEKDIDNFCIESYGGGTNLDAPVRAFSKKKNVNKIVFTDGYSLLMPKNDLQKINVIWVIYGYRSFNPCCGKVIQANVKDILARQNMLGEIQKHQLCITR